LPAQLKWDDVVRQKLTVEVPGSWSFDKMIAALIDRPIPASGVIHIGNALYADNRLPPGQGWLVSSKNSDGESQEPKILDSNAQPLLPADLHSQTQKVSSNNVNSDPTLHTVRPRPNNPPTRGATERTVSLTNDNGRNGEPTEKQTTATGKADIERLFNEIAVASRRHDKGIKDELFRFVKRVLEKDHAALVRAETHLMLLLAPVVTTDLTVIMISWKNLLHEIMTSYHQPLPGMRDDWINRLDSLLKITIKNLDRPPLAWESEFSEACFALRTILKDS
jgi:hypothetical protein